MEEFKNLYRAFREYREKAQQDALHETIMKSLLADANADEGSSGKLRRCEWDDEWISAMLEALPYVERALDEQRKFIESHEEIRRIDQAKRITVESVRHLAQHSNMISNVQGDEIIPDRVLNVERDDNYAIYENRFLFTLIKRMQEFLDERYNAVSGLNGARVHAYHMQRSASWNRRHFESCIKFTFEQKAEKKRMDADVEEMTSMEKIYYLRARVGDLLCAPLMRLLKGVTPVSAPIVRTNVFKKNDNFKRALELFEYLEKYSKPGYEIIADESGAGRLSNEFRSELCELAALEYFIGEINSNDDLRAALEANFAWENEQAELDRIRAEEEREQAVLARIEAARQEEIAIREAEIAMREAKISKLNSALLQKDDQLKALNEESKREKKRHADEISAIQHVHRDEMDSLKAERRSDQESFESEKKELIEKMERERELAVRNEQIQAAADLIRAEESYNQRVEELYNGLERKHEGEMKRLKKKYQGRISACNAELEECEEKLERAERKLEKLKEEKGFSLMNFLRK